VDAVHSAVDLDLVRCQFTSVVDPQSKVVDPARLAHSVHEYLQSHGEGVGLLV
jgi:hypothetical protein